ncbi:MAG: condensation domain-containing protein, partial [Ktedonobacteraceae bacterium]
MSEQTASHGFRLSPQQQRLWILQQEGRTQYAQCALLIEGNLDKQRLNRALQVCVARHEILRTTFQQVPLLEYPLQVIDSQGHVLQEEIDLSALDVCIQEEVIQQLIQTQRLLPFDLKNSSPLRITLITQTQAQHILLIGVAALCADSATFRYLLEACSQAYVFFEQDELEEYALQYADFTTWQIETLELEQPLLAREYWQKHIQHVNKPELKWLERTITKNTMSLPPVPLTIAARLDTVTQLRILAEQHQLSVEGILLTGWFILLWRLSGTTSIGVGLIAQGRDVSEPQKLLGPVARCLPLLLKMERQTNILQVLKRVEELLSEAREWEVYFDPAHKQEGSIATNAVHSMPIAFEYSEWPQYAADGLIFKIISQSICAEPADLKLTCNIQQQALYIDLQYNPALYAKDSIARLLGYY